MMERVANWPSTCANQSPGSAGQNGGNFRLMVLMTPGVVAGAASVSLIVGVTNVEFKMSRMQFTEQHMD